MVNLELLETSNNYWDQKGSGCSLVMLIMVIFEAIGVACFVADNGHTSG